MAFNSSVQELLLRVNGDSKGGQAALAAFATEIRKAKADVKSLTDDLKDPDAQGAFRRVTEEMLGDAIAKTEALKIGFANARKEMRGAAEDVKAISLKEFASAASTAGRALSLNVTAPIVAASVASLKFASDFEGDMTKISTLSGGISKSDLPALKKSILDLGPAVGIGPDALAKAMLVITSTGLDATHGMEVLKESAKGAAVGLGETADVARTITTVLTAYGTENITAARAAEILFKTVKDGGAEAASIAPQLGRVIAIGQQMGVSFEEIGASIATFTRLGVGADIAVTGLRDVLTHLLDPSKKAQSALAEIGLSAQKVRDIIREQGLAAALQLLMDRTHGNVEQIAEMIGDVRGLTVVLGTAGSQSKQYAEELQHLKADTNELGGAMKDTADTTQFKWNQLKAELESLAIVTGDKLLPIVKRLIDEALIPGVKHVDDMVQAWEKLPDGVKTAGEVIIVLAAAGGPVLLGLGALARAIAAIQTLLFGANAAAGTSIVSTLGRLGITGGAVLGAAPWAIGNNAETRQLSEADIARMQGTMGGLPPIPSAPSRGDIDLFSRSGTVVPGVTYAGGLKMPASDGFAPPTAGAKKFDAVLKQLNAAVDTLYAKLTMAAEAGTPAEQVLQELGAEASKLVTESLRIPGAYDALPARIKLLSRAFDQANIAKTLEEIHTKSEALQKSLGKDTQAEIAKTAAALDASLAAVVIAQQKASDQLVISRKVGLDKQLAEIDFAEKEELAKYAKVPVGMEEIFAKETDLVRAKYDEQRKLATKFTGDVLRDADLRGIKSKQALEGELAVEKRVLAEMLADHNRFTDAAIEKQREAVQAAEAALEQLGPALLLSFEASLKRIPDLIKSAFTGGGGAQGALKAIAADLGSSIGTVLTQALSRSLSRIVTSRFSGSGGGVGLGEQAATVGLGAGTSIAGDVITSAVTGGAAAGGAGAAAPGLAAAIGTAATAAAVTAGISLAVIGAIALYKKYHQPEWAKLGKDIGRDFGINVSEEALKAMEADSKKFGRGVAELLHLKDIFAAGGGITPDNVALAAQKLHDVFSGIQTGQLSIAQGTQIIEDNWDDLVAAGTDDFGFISERIKDLIALDDQFGTHSKAIAQYLKDQAKIAVDGSNAAIDSLSDQLDYWKQLKSSIDDAKKAGADWMKDQDAVKNGRKSLADMQKEQTGLATQERGHLEDLGIIAVATFGAARAAGASFSDALAQAAPGLNDLSDAFEALGISTDNAALKALQLQAGILRNNPTLIQGVANLGNTFAALSNMGALNVDTFQAMQRAGAEMYTRVQGEVAKFGGSTKDALIPMQDYLHKAEEAAKKLGVPLDDVTANMIKDSKEFGIWQETGQTAAEQQEEATVSLAKSILDLTGKIEDLIDTLLGIPPKVTTTVETNYTTTGDPDPNTGVAGPHKDPNGPTTTPTAHTGAIVHAGLLRHFHQGKTRVNGLKHGEVLAVIKDDEAVIRSEAVRALGPDFMAFINSVTPGDMAGTESRLNAPFRVPASATSMLMASAGAGTTVHEHHHVWNAIDGASVRKFVNSPDFIDAFSEANARDRRGIATKQRRVLGVKRGGSHG